jgi:hypothetical protein
MSEIRKWLEAIGLGQYADAFESNDIDMDLLQHVHDQTLKDIGIASTGHRLRIRSSIAKIGSVAKPEVTGSTKTAPSRGGSLRAPRQIPSNGGLTDLDAELEQFSMDARCAPERVVQAHLTDQVAYFVPRLGPPGQRDRHRQ